MQNRNHWIYKYLNLESEKETPKKKQDVDKEIGDIYIEKMKTVATDNVVGRSNSTVETPFLNKINSFKDKDFKGNEEKLSSEDRNLILIYLNTQCEEVRYFSNKS